MIAAVAGLCLAGAARADGAAVRAVLFGSLDAGPSAFTSAGVRFAPGGIDREGFTGLAVIGGGLRTEAAAPSPGADVPVLIRATLLGAALGGYQAFFDWGVAALFAGPEIASEALPWIAPVADAPTRLGLRIQGEVWARPSENTLATATLILGSARGDLYGRVSAGYRVLGAYLGPEAATYADRTGYRNWALGLHATEFAWGGVSMRVSAGYLYESETRSLGPYIALASWMSL